MAEYWYTMTKVVLDFKRSLKEKSLLSSLSTLSVFFFQNISSQVYIADKPIEFFTEAWIASSAVWINNSLENQIIMKISWKMKAAKSETELASGLAILSPHSSEIILCMFMQINLYI